MKNSEQRKHNLSSNDRGRQIQRGLSGTLQSHPRRAADGADEPLTPDAEDGAAQAQPLGRRLGRARVEHDAVAAAR